MTEWQERFSVGNDVMDNIHKEFLTLLKLAAKADTHDFEAAFEALIRHTREHFFFENTQMQNCQPASMKEHQAEHEHVLAEMEYFYSKAVQGRRSFARAYILQKLPDWLAQHTATMDADLAAKLSSD